MSTIVGIDLGSFHNRIATMDVAGNPILIPNEDGEHAILAGVCFTEQGTTLWGQQGLNESGVDPSRYVFDIKRFTGTDKVVATIDGREYRAWEIQQIQLEKCRALIEKHLGGMPGKVVISVPANYSDNRKADVLRAAKAAGLDILKLEHEPTSAAVGTGVHRRGNGIVLLLDPGGTTTDVSVIEVSGNNIQVITTNGLPELGGSNFNALLRDHLLEKFEQQCGRRLDADELLFQHELGLKVEQAKRTLSVKQEARVAIRRGDELLDARVSRSEYDKLTAPLISEIMDCLERTLEEANTKPDEVSKYVVVGATSNDPAFARDLRQRIGREPWPHSDPVYAGVKGNVILGRMVLEQQGHAVEAGGRRLPPLRLSARDVTAHPIGVAVLTDDDRLVNSIVLPKGMPIPCDRTEHFRLAESGDTDARIEILQGLHGAPLDQCVSIGHFELTGAQAVHDREHPIELRYRIDGNGMLTAVARDPIGGASAEMTIAYRQGAAANGQT